MDITLSKTQKDITKEARRFLSKECTVDYVQEMFDDEKGFTDEKWDKMVGMDWMAMRIPENYGGMGMEQIDLTMILEEMGRAVAPGPFFSTIMLAAETIMEAGNDAQKEKYLPAIADGKMKGTLALHEADGGADVDYVHMKAISDGENFILNGVKLYVPDAHLADFLVVATRTDSNDDPEHGITLFLTDVKATGITTTILPTMDSTRKLSVTEFNDVRLKQSDILGQVNKGWAPLKKIIQRAQVGLCAECVGGAQRVMEIATDYAKVRVQYDQPIGAFQAIKHMCAQMFVEAESSRSLLYWAAWAQDHGDEKEAALSASTAKAYCTEAFTKVAGNGIQVLGGTGFTKENEMHLYLKRAKANEVALGDPVYHRENVIQLLTT